MSWSAARCGRLRAKRLIGELHQRHLIVRRLDHSIQLRLLPPLLRRLQLSGTTAQFAGQVDGLLHFERGGRRAIRPMLGKQPLDPLLKLFGHIAEIDE